MCKTSKTHMFLTSDFHEYAETRIFLKVLMCKTSKTRMFLTSDVHEYAETHVFLKVLMCKTSKTRMFLTSDFHEHTETHVFLDILEARSGHFWAHAAKVLKMTLLGPILAISGPMPPKCSK